MKLFTRKYLSTLVLIVLLGILFFSPNAKAYVLKALLSTGIFNADTKKNNKVIDHMPFAQLAFTDKNAAPLNTADLKGKIILVNFWATWCPPCIAEMGSLNTLYNKLKADPRFVFIMADADGNLPLSDAFMQKRGYSLPVYQIAGPVPADLFAGTLPTTLIIDAKGNLVQKHEGIANYDTPEMLAFLKSL
ncbi:MAG: TlpA disulfide reductase family protein [Chitinophagaceae bacterium]